MKSFKLDQLSHLLNCATLPSLQIQGFCVDTRLIQPGEVYIALKGARVDGHAFLAEAKSKGAIAGIVSKNYSGPDHGLLLLRVSNPLQALQDLAKSFLSEKRTRIAAITGSLGKTTTKDFTTSLLRTQYRVMSTPGNFNSQIGLPLAILNHMKGDEEILVIEMGMTSIGDITKLIQITPPEVALITTIALVHACHFKNGLADIARAKSEIFSHPQTRMGIMNYDMPYFGEIAKVGSCPKINFSMTSSSAHYYLETSYSNELTMKSDGQSIRLNALTVLGKHNYQNLLAAIALARYFNVSWELINEVIPLLKMPDKRLQLINHKGVIFLNDSYNAAELSTKAALEALPAPNGSGRKIAVLGSMMELGQYSDEVHRRVGEFALNHVEEMYCFGEECQPIYQVWKKAGRPVELFLDRNKLIEALRAVLKPSDVVLLKGSRSKEMWKVLEEL